MGTWVLKSFLALLILRSAEATFDDTSQWVSIDCGAEAADLDSKIMINWETDDDYTSTGINKNVSGDLITKQMKTLRCFPDDGPNCYSFSVDTITKYLIRARFYYGNYDGLSNPPTFDMSVNGLNWTTVVTSASEDPVVLEAVFSLGTDILHVCLSKVDVGVPFISSLEVTPWPFNTYSEIDLGTAFVLQSRISFGGREDIGYNGNYSGDQLNRIWKAEGPSNYVNVTPSSSIYVGYLPNQPPDSALQTAIEAPSLFDPIIIPVNLTKSNQSNQSLCVMLYFVELNQTQFSNDTRKFQINVGGQKNLSSVDLQRYTPQLVVLSLQVEDGATNITLSPSVGSTLPPIVNAMEIYTTMRIETPSSPTSRAGSVSSPGFALLWMCALCLVVYVALLVTE